MAGEFILSQKISLWDYYRASLYVGIRNRRLRWLCFFAIVAGILNLLANLMANTKPNSKMWVLILQSTLPLLILLLFIFVGTFLISVLIKKIKPGIFSNITYQFTHWGMYKKNEAIDYSIPWRNIMKVKETKSFIFLYFSRDEAHVIAKKIFRHNDELLSFKNFMNTCLNQ